MRVPFPFAPFPVNHFIPDSIGLTNGNKDNALNIGYSSGFSGLQLSDLLKFMIYHSDD